MRIAEILKAATGLGTPEPKQINQDGKQYTFQPGEGGGMTAPAPTPTPVPDYPKAKVITTGTARG